MIRVTKIEVRGESDAGSFNGALELSAGLQVISARNAFGKSIAMTSIAWCLGVEPIFGLLGDEPSCFPLAVREEIDLEGHQRARVLSSQCRIKLQRGDGLELQLTRDIKGDSTNALVEEFQPDGRIRRSKLVVRQATMHDEHGGLQRFLFEWLGWPVQSALNFRGMESKVYLENLAPLFYIDQKEGWIDLQTLQVGRYGQQQISEIALEYLLGATDAIAIRVARQVAAFKDLAQRQSAKVIADRISAFTVRHGWNIDWSAHGSVQETLARWSLHRLRETLLQEADVDLSSRRQSLEGQAEALRRALTTDVIDSTDLSAASSVSQKVVDLKRRRHDLNDELRTLRTQHAEFEELVSSLEHRVHAANDVLRLKTTGVGRLESVECPTCHRELDPSTFALTDQSESSISMHIEALNRDRQLMMSNLQAITARLTANEAESMRLNDELRTFERSLVTVNAAVGTVREQLARTAGELTAVEHVIDQTIEASSEIDDLQSAIDKWIAEASALQSSSQEPPDLRRRTDAFLNSLREYLMALGHSAVNSANAHQVRLDERYVPYLDARRLRSLGSASDQSRLVAAYSLALAAASHEVGGLHPGVVLLDEPLQQNPDDPHRDLFVGFLGNQLARRSTFQTVIFTSLRSQEIELLRQNGFNVITPEGEHFLKLQQSR